MLKANSSHENELGSSLADLLVSATGIKSYIKTELVKPQLREAMSHKYTSDVQSLASSPDMWGSSASLLEASITEDDQVVVRAVGSDEDVYSASLLEYGTPDMPPRPIMRQSSLELTEEFKQAIKGFNQ